MKWLKLRINETFYNDGNDDTLFCCLFSPAGANLESSRHLKTKIPQLHGKFFRGMDLFNIIGASRYQKLESNEKKIHERLHN